MAPTTILIDETPRCVVRPTDQKALTRFLRNSRAYLQAGKADGVITHRDADAAELAKWRDGLALHAACGGDEEDFSGVPL
jgi:hypothetical protein